MGKTKIIIMPVYPVKAVLHLKHDSSDPEIIFFVKRNLRPSSVTATNDYTAMPDVCVAGNTYSRSPLVFIPIFIQ